MSRSGRSRALRLHRLESVGVKLRCANERLLVASVLTLPRSLGPGRSADAWHSGGGAAAGVTVTTSPPKEWPRAVGTDRPEVLARPGRPRQPVAVATPSRRRPAAATAASRGLAAVAGPRPLEARVCPALGAGPVAWPTSRVAGRSVSRLPPPSSHAAAPSFVASTVSVPAAPCWFAAAAHSSTATVTEVEHNALQGVEARLQRASIAVAPTRHCCAAVADRALGGMMPLQQPRRRAQAEHHPRRGPLPPTAAMPRGLRRALRRVGGARRRPTAAEGGKRR